MDYFAISQDIALSHAIRFNRDFIPEDWKKEIARGRSVEFKYGELPDKKYNFPIKSDKEKAYPDLIEAPLPLLSTRIKEIFCGFENRIQCNCAILSDKDLRKQEVYWLFALERVECLSNDTEFYPNGTLKKLVLDERRIGKHTVFRVKGILEKQIVIRFDVVESILRRPVMGVQLKKIECQEETIDK